MISYLEGGAKAGSISAQAIGKQLSHLQDPREDEAMFRQRQSILGLAYRRYGPPTRFGIEGADRCCQKKPA